MKKEGESRTEKLWESLAAEAGSRGLMEDTTRTHEKEKVMKQDTI